MCNILKVINDAQFVTILHKYVSIGQSHYLGLLRNPPVGALGERVTVTSQPEVRAKKRSLVR